MSHAPRASNATPELFSGSSRMVRRAISLEQLVEKYIGELDWLVRENANVPRTVSGMVSYILGNLLVEEASRLLPRKAILLHREGWIHIYKLRDGSILKPYCGGIDARLIVEKGLRTPTIVSRPPKHLDSAVDQLMNAAYIFSQERTGAIGLYGVDLVVAPFIRREQLSYREVKQNVQRFIFNLNYPLKAGQSPFTNVVFAISNRYYHGMPDPSAPKTLRLGGGARLGDYIEEAKLVVKAMMEVFAEGDASGQPFTFPIPTTIANQLFEKLLSEDPELWRTYWGAVARSGQMYFLNGYRHSAEDIFSFCCRLLSDMARVREILHKAKGVWDMPPSVGSVNVVVINCPRLAMYARVSGEEKHMWDKLDELLEVARETLMWFRQRYIKLFRAGMYPMTREYIDPENPFKYYYNTVGVIGMAEYAAIMLGKPRLWIEEPDENLGYVAKLYRDLLNHIQDRLREFEDLDNVLYNVEEVPGESLSVRLAWLDWEWVENTSFGGEDLRIYIPVGDVGGRKAPYYTNQLTPPYTTLHLRKQLWLESECQKLFTGGVIKHVFIDRELSPEVIAKFVTQTLRNSDIVYMSVTPTIAVCPACGYRAIGRIEKCPRCGSRLDLWSRTVGYYRPLKSWNEGRVAEFYARRDLSQDILDIVGH